MDDLKEILRNTVDDLENRERFYLSKPNPRIEKVKYMKTLIKKLKYVQNVVDRLKHISFWHKIEDEMELLRMKDKTLNAFEIRFNTGFSKQNHIGYINLIKNK